MRIDTQLVRLMTEVLEWQRSLVLKRGDDPERGDVPGWVFVTMMSAALVGVLYLVAAPALEGMLTSVLKPFSP